MCCLLVLTHGREISGQGACHAGAVQFLFRLPDGSRYVHCGDMRYCAAMQNNEQLQGFVGADAVFLDTTYCKGKYQFPPQVTPLTLPLSIALQCPISPTRRTMSFFVLSSMATCGRCGPRWQI